MLNPYPNARFTRCPRCEARTRIRKLALVIHVDEFGMAILGKTCRVCLACEVLIAHHADIEGLLGALLGGAVVGRKFLVLGTV